MSQRKIHTGQAFRVGATLQRDDAFCERLGASAISLQQSNEFGLLPFIPMLRVLRQIALLALHPSTPQRTFLNRKQRAKNDFLVTNLLTT
jgi:hypothetical protein